MGKKTKANERGFTIIEVMIVLAIAALILIIVFLAVPALKRSQRNLERRQDAQVIFAAIEECLDNGYSTDYCASPVNLNITQSELGIFTTTDSYNSPSQCQAGFQCMGVGVHYGTSCINWVATHCPSMNPDGDQASYLFGINCDGSPGPSTQFILTYWAEAGNFPGVSIPCLVGQ